MTELIDVAQGFKTVLEMNNVVPSSIIKSRPHADYWTKPGFIKIFCYSQFQTVTNF